MRQILKIVTVFFSIMMPLTLMPGLTGCGKIIDSAGHKTSTAETPDLVVRGEFVSLRETQLMAPFVTEVVELVPEGTVASSGTLLARLSTGGRDQTLKEKQSDLESFSISVERDKALLGMARQVEEKSIELAALEHAKCLIEYERAIDGRDWLRLTEQEETYRAGKVRAEMLAKQFDASKKMAQKGFAARQELASHEKDLLVHKLTASFSLRLIDFVEHFADAREVFAAREALERASLASELASFTAPKNLADYQFSLNESQRRYEQSLLQANEIENELASLTIRAPADGLLLYGDTYDGSQLLKMRRGAQVYPGLTFLKIVDSEFCGVQFPLDQRDALLISSTTQLFYRPDALPELLFPCRFETKVPVALEIPQSKPDGRTQVVVKATIASYPANLMIGYSGTVFSGDYVADMLSRFRGKRKAVIGRRSLRRVVSTSGDVKPASASFIVGNLDGKLSEIAEEGQGVKAGDRIALLDCEELIQSAKDQEIELKKKNEEYQLQLQKNDIDSEKIRKSVEVKRGAYEVAKLKHAALLKRRSEDKIIDLQRSLEVLVARIALAEEKITHIAELRHKGLSSELEALQSQTELADLKKEHKITAYKLKTEESGPTKRSKKLSELEVRRAALDLEKAELQGSLDNLRNLMATRLLDAQIKRLEMNLASTREDIDSAAIKAPADGVVILNEFNKPGGGMGKAKVGDNIYSRIPFMQVADVGNLQIHCIVSEMDARFIKRGDEVKLLLKGNSSKKLRGWVDSVGIVATTEFRKRQDAVVAVIINLVSPVTGQIESDPALRPGSSCEVEFLLYDLSDALFLPFDGLLPTATASCVVTDTGKLQAVDLHFVDGLNGAAIAGGLSEGDEILLMEAAND
ncbi:MAG: hypothetical protein PHD82_04665 [Candidatus Riflebacteria bacterium]|nr:hypothetical protein [Candidatus Riflebacteria bacterium]